MSARVPVRFAALLVAGLLAAGLGLWGCGDDVQGQLRLLVVPLHQGRNPIQDPFNLVDRVELGLMAEDGGYRALGRARPLARFGPGLIGAAGRGAPALTGLNERGRPVSRGFGPALALEPGVDAWVSVPFARVDYAVARRLRAAERELADPFAGRAPSLRLDAANLEQGQLESADDASALVWLLWDDDTLWARVRVRDDSVEPVALPGSLAGGDGVTFYLADRQVTVSADGQAQPADAVSQVAAERVAGGYLLTVGLPLAEASKNLELGFDLRLTDRDAAATPSLLTWVFDPQQAGEDPLPEQYGRLLLGVELLDVLDQPGSRLGFAGPDGEIGLSGSWDADALHLTVEVPDDEVRAGGPDGLEGADRVEFWLDLANGQPPAMEPARFFRVTAGAGGSAAHGAGPDPANLTDQGVAFSGQVRATSRLDGYTIDLTLPFADLQFDQPPQRGWFLGLEVRVVDEDEGGAQEASWSDAATRPDRWGELRLFSME